MLIKTVNYSIARYLCQDQILPKSQETPIKKPEPIFLSIFVRAMGRCRNLFGGKRIKKLIKIDFLNSVLNISN